MSDDVNSENVEYVEYLEADYEENQEVVTIDEENLQQVEYIEAQQVTGDVVYTEEGYAQIDGHTIFEHNGKQYMIPNELHQSGQTILLEDCTPIEEGQQFLLDDSNAVDINDDTSQVNSTELIYTELEGSEENTEWKEAEHINEYAEDSQDCEEISDLNEDSQHEEILSSGRQYAILKDGKLHMEGSENQEKLQQLQESLGLDDECLRTEDESSEQVEEVTGKNLLTGQTISLSGFLEKLKRKADPFSMEKYYADDKFYPDSVKRQRRSYYNQGRSEKRFTEIPRPDYVLLPPVNKKVLVGKTSDGKNIVGNILQIWKKIDNTEQKIPKPRTVRKKVNPKPKVTDKPTIEEVMIDSTGKIITKDSKSPQKNVIIKKKIVSKAFLDENIVKTLSGLMELETIQKILYQKNLVIKHILKKSREGKILPGKEITYYYGHMEKDEKVDCFNETKTTWTFISHYKDTAKNIDLNMSNDKQQVELSADGEISFRSLTDNDINDSSAHSGIKTEFTESVPVNLIVIEDEYGKKRTKVTIPQLPGQKWQSRRSSTEDNIDNICAICHRTFTSSSSLRRHMATHASGIEYDQLTSQYSITTGASTRQYSCGTCGKTFSRHSNMLRHSDIHRQPSTKEKENYTCEICGCQYNFISSLTRHIVQNHMQEIKNEPQSMELVDTHEILLSADTQEIIAEEIDHATAQQLISNSQEFSSNSCGNIGEEISVQNEQIIIQEGEVINENELLLSNDPNVQIITKSEIIVQECE